MEERWHIFWFAEKRFFFSSQQQDFLHTMRQLKFIAFTNDLQTFVIYYLTSFLYIFILRHRNAHLKIDPS